MEEVRPRLREMLVYPAKGCRVENFAGFRIRDTFLQKSDFLAARVIRQGLDHAVGAGGDDSGIEVKVTGLLLAAIRRF